MQRYKWVVEFRNDRMGFTKTKRVPGRDYRDAIFSAKYELMRDGYNSRDFSVTDVSRGKQLPALRRPLRQWATEEEQHERFLAETTPYRADHSRLTYSTGDVKR
jgi:hypothetical protein